MARYVTVYDTKSKKMIVMPERVAQAGISSGVYTTQAPVQQAPVQQSQRQPQGAAQGWSARNQATSTMQASGAKTPAPVQKGNAVPGQKGTSVMQGKTGGKPAGTPGKTGTPVKQQGGVPNLMSNLLPTVGKTDPLAAIKFDPSRPWTAATARKQQGRMQVFSAMNNLLPAAVRKQNLAQAQANWEEEDLQEYEANNQRRLAYPAAARVWKAAQKEYTQGVERDATTNYKVADKWGAMIDPRANKGYESGQMAGIKKTNNLIAFDQTKLNKDIWGYFTDKERKALIGQCDTELLRMYPQLDAATRGKAAEELAKGRAAEAMYNYAVEQNAPKSVLEFLARKVADGNLLFNAVDAIAVAGTGKRGTIDARDEAMAKYGEEHKVADIVGTVGGMVLDPANLAGGGAAKGAGRVVNSAMRAGARRGGKFLTKPLAQRIFPSMASSGAMFGTYEGLHDIPSQVRSGAGYNPMQTLGTIGHGVIMGASMGGSGALIGNVGDIAVARMSTGEKLATRAVQHTIGIGAEATVFALPDVLIPQFRGEYEMNPDGTVKTDAEGNPVERKTRMSFGQAWEDQLGIVLGFKAHGAIKGGMTYGGMLLNSWRKPTSRTEYLGHQSFWQQALERMTQNPQIGLTTQQWKELEEHGYKSSAQFGSKKGLEGTAAEWREKERQERTARARGEEPSENSYMHTRTERTKGYGKSKRELVEYYDEIERLLNDESVSWETRAKVCYLFTGKTVPLPTIMGYHVNEHFDDNDVFVYKELVATDSKGAPVMSRRFGSHGKWSERDSRTMRTEESRLRRQVELNQLDIAEKRNDEWYENLTIGMAARTTKAYFGLDDESFDNLLRRREEGQADHGGKEMVNIPTDTQETDILGFYDDMKNRFVEKVKNEGVATSSDLRLQIMKEAGVDVDAVIKKPFYRRSEEENEALRTYMKGLGISPHDIGKRFSDGFFSSEGETSEDKSFVAGGQRAEASMSESEYDPESEQKEGMPPNGADAQMGEASRPTAETPPLVTGTVRIRKKDGDGEMLAEVDVFRSDDGRNVIFFYDDKEGKHTVEALTDEELQSRLVEVLEPQDDVADGADQADVQTAETPEEQVITEGISETGQGFRDAFRDERERIGNEWLDNEDVQSALKEYAEGAGSVEELVERAKADSTDERTKRRLDTLLEFDSTRRKLERLMPSTSEGVTPHRGDVANKEEYEQGYRMASESAERASDRALENLIATYREQGGLSDYNKGMLHGYEDALRRRKGENVPRATRRDSTTPPPQDRQVTEAKEDNEAGEHSQASDALTDAPMRENNGDTAQAGANGRENVPAQAEMTALQRLPKDEKGKPMFEQAESAEDGWDALVEHHKGDAAKAKVTADIMVENKRKAYEKAKKRKPKGNDPDEVLASQEANEAALKKAEEEYLYWQKIAEVENLRQAALHAERDAEQARIKAEREERERFEREERDRIARGDKALKEAYDRCKDVPEALDVLRDNEPHDIYEAISLALSTHKLLLNDDGVMRGWRSETGLTEGERKKFFGMFARKENGGMSIARLSEDVVKEICDTYGIHYDQQEAYNAIIEMLSSSDGPNAIYNYIRNNRIDQANSIIDQLEAEEARYAWEEWERFENEMHMNPEEWEAYNEYMENEMIALDNHFKDFDFSEHYANIAEEIEKEYGKDIDRRSEGDASRGRNQKDVPVGTLVRGEGLHQTGDIGKIQERLGNVEENLLPGVGHGEPLAPEAGGEQNPTGTGPSERGAGPEDDGDRGNTLEGTRDRSIAEFFGPVYTEFRGKGNEAEAYLREMCEGVAKGALTYPGVAPIDLAWGDKKAGYMKIVIKHPEVVGRLQELLNQCSITNQSENRIVFECDTHKIIVSKMKGSTPTDNWLLTAYQKKEKSVSASSSDIETEPEGMRNGTATPQNGLSGSSIKTGVSTSHGLTSGRKVTNSASDKQENGEKSSIQPSDNKGEQTVQSAVEAASAEVNTEPTPAQAEAGNLDLFTDERKQDLSDKYKGEDNQGNPIDHVGNLIVEDVKSVDEITDDDFTNPTRTVGLPPLPKIVRHVLSTNGKRVIIKKNIFERNALRHNELTPAMSRVILNNALYNPSLYGKNKPLSRPNNWIVINVPDGKDNNRLVVLEVNENKDNVEIVHWHEVDNRGLAKIKRQAEREDGQLLILPSGISEEAGALSGPTFDSPNEELSPSSEVRLTETPKESEGLDLVPTSDNFVSGGKVTNSTSDKQEDGEKSSIQPSDNKGEQTVQSAVEAASAEVNTEPTPAQAEAGNYKKGHVTIGEFDITIENPAGSVRKGVGADGKEWSTTMANTYGYIKGTEGVDGDHIDVFLRENMDSWNGRKVFVVDQSNTDGSFDEHKVMLGFNDKDEAMNAYLANYDKTWADTHPGLRISETNIEDFNKWVQSSHRKTKPFAEYSTVSKVVDDAPVKTEPQEQPSAAIEGDGYKIVSNPYTNKQGKTLDTYLVTFDRDLSKEEMSALRAKAKALKGWYDRESKGWMLRSSEDAKAFAEDVTAKSEDDIADEAPLSLADMEKQKPKLPAKQKGSLVKKVDVEGVFDALKTKGETNLNDHAKSVEEAPKPKKRRWISDEDADEFDSLRKDLRSHFGKDNDMVHEDSIDYGKPQPKQMDAEVLRMGTRMTYLMMKGGLRSFADYCEAMKDELPDIFDEMRPHLKSLYAAAQNMEEVMQLGWDDEMDDRKAVKAFDVYNFDKTGAKDIIETAAHTVDELQSQEQTDQIIQNLKDQRNEQRKTEADKTSADTETIIDKAEATASQVESQLESARTEQDAERLSRSIDKEIEEVNKQLALLGYYEADPVDKDFNEAYGYMRNAERKAVNDAHRLATQLAADLGIEIDPKDKVRKSKYGFGSKIARGNVAPAGGEVYITLPLTESRELSIWLSLDKNAPWREGGRQDRYDEDLMLTGIMYRVENISKGDMDRYESRNYNSRPTIPYDELLSDIRRLVRTYLPDEHVKPATPLAPQSGEDIVDMAKRVATDKEPKSTNIEPQLPIANLFGDELGFLDNQGNPIDHVGKLIVKDVKSVDEITDDDFVNPTRTVGLPELPEIVAKTIGANGKLIIKKNIFGKNRNRHQDLTPADSRKILHTALYTPSLYGRNQNQTRPYNWILIHLADKNTCVLLEVDNSKDNCEIVNWHYLNDRQLEQKKRQAEREGGRILTLQESNAAGDTSQGLSSEGKGNKKLLSEKINERTDVQTRSEESWRRGQQPRPDEQVGTGAEHENEAASNIELTEEDSEPTASEPNAEYSAGNVNFASHWINSNGVQRFPIASRYETADGKTVRYTSENPEAYGGLFNFDFQGENSGSHAVDNRAGANGVQRQGNSLLNQFDSRLDEEAGEFSVVERVFTENGSFNFTSGEKIESADDVAFIFSALEDAAKEHSFVVLVKDGKPTVVELGMGTFTATMVDVPTASLAYNRVRPDQVYFVHNHPSGNLMCSPQDVQMLKKIGEMSDVPVMGVIINLKTGKYGTFDTNNNSGTSQKRSPEKEYALTVHTLDKQIFAPDYDPMTQPLVRSSSDVAQLLNSHRMGDRAKVSFLILSRAGRIVGNIHTPFTEIPADVDDMARYISERVIQFGGESAILYGDFNTAIEKHLAYRKLKERLTQVGATTLLDVVQVNGNHTASANDEGLLYEPGSEYGASPEGDIRFREVEETGRRFDEEIDRYERGELLPGHRFELGTPSVYLRSAGFPDLPISMRSSLLKMKSGLGRHPFEAKDLKGLVKSLQKPIAIFAYSRDNIRNIIADVMHGDKHFLVGVTLNYKAGDIEINSVSRLFPKESHEWVKWIQDGKAIRIDQKEKVQQIIDSLRMNPGEAERIGLNLDYAAKLVKNFENLAIESVENSDIRPRKADRQAPQTSSEAKNHHAEQLSKKFNTPVRIVTDIKELPVALRDKKGAFDVKSGEVVVVIPNHESVEDVAETVFHEVVAHKGLREMLGEENYDAFCDEVYNHLKDDLKEEVDKGTTRRFMNEPGKGYEHHRRVSVDELFGRMAEKGFEDFTEAERGIWAKLKAKVLEAINKFLGSLKLPKWVNLGDNELRYMLWRSHERLRGKDSYVDTARDTAKRDELGLNKHELLRDTPEMQELRRVNNRFNEQLEHLTEDNADATHLTLGHPSSILIAAGVENKSMKLYGNKLIKKMKKHGFELSELRNLPQAVAYPIAVFDNIGREGNRSILTELATKQGNVLVTIDTGKGPDVDFNIISSIFGKGSEKIVNWINKGYATFLDKEKAQEFLFHQSAPIAATAANSEPMKALKWLTQRESHAHKYTLQELNDAAKVINSFENPKLADEGSVEYRFRDGETDDIWKDRSVSLEERITHAAIRLSNNQRGDLTRRNEAMRAIGGNLASLRKAMSLQRKIDQTTVKRVADLARILMQNGYLSDMTSGEIQRLISAVKNSVGHQEVKESVQNIMGIMVSNQLRNGEATLQQLLTIKGSKVDARGVEVQGMLDVDGQRTMEVVKKAMSLTEDDINDRIEEAMNRISDPNATISDQATLEYVGLSMALDYVQNIKGSKDEESKLRDGLRTAKDDKDAGRMTTDAYRQYVEATEDAIRKNKIERAEAYFNLVGRLSDSLRGSIENAKAFRQAEKARVNDIHHKINSDMEGRPTNEYHEDDWKDKIVNNGFVQSLFAPLCTFDQILRVIGNKSANGEGYVYSHIMRGWIDCRNKELLGVKEKYARLDEKAAELFGKGKTIADLIRMEGKLPKATVSFWDGGEMRDHELTQGNLLYIYMVDKMTDGRMKLRRMGITEDKVAKIEEMLDPRFKAFCDWLQEDFLVETRNEYNETHKRMFGASMAAIENYFPLKILANARVDKVDDVNRKNQPEGITTKTGSIIKRRVNNLALDITGADALSMILDHIIEMEHWNAYAEWNRDLNTIRTYKRFRNQVINMTTVYGGGRKLWDKFNDLCLLAAGQYRPRVGKLSKELVNLTKGVTAAKVTFRMFTAWKQFLSAPAYIPEVSTAAFAKSIINPYGDFKWCMENMPIFRERWHSRISGDPRLLETDMDWKGWRNRIMELTTRFGMTPNAFVDAVTVSIGAKAMYDTRLKQYLKEGYSSEAAEKRALQDATILFNQTQQSSESPFLSTMQRDHGWASTIFTMFRNSSMSYTRQQYDALRNLKRNLTSGQRAKSVEFMTKQILRDWDIDPENATAEEKARAENAAKKRFNRQIRKDILRTAVFGYGLQLLWNLGAYLPYLIFGKNEQEKDSFWKDAVMHALFGSVEGLTGGDLMSSFGNMAVSGDWSLDQLEKDHPAIRDLELVIRDISRNDYQQALWDFGCLTGQVLIGATPQIVMDVAAAVCDACHWNLGAATEVTLFLSRFFSVPQSQTENIYFDEIEMTATEASKMTPREIAERYAKYQAIRTGHLFNKEDFVLDYKASKLNPKMKERILNTGDAEVERRYGEYEDLYRGYDKQKKHANVIKKDGDMVKYAEACAGIHQAYDEASMRYFQKRKKRLNTLADKWLHAKTPEEAARYAKELREEKRALVKDMDERTAAKRRA